VGLERGPLSLVSTTVELLGRVSAPVKKTEITDVGIRRAYHATPIYPLKLALTSPTSSVRSVGIVRSLTKSMDVIIIIITIIIIIIIINSGIHKRQPQFPGLVLPPDQN
jgi:hypothetical protein